MPALDNKTILFISAMLYVVFCVALLFLRASLKNYRGPGYWAAGACGVALSTPVLIMQGYLPPTFSMFSILLADLGVIASMCMVAHGFCVFLGLSRRKALYSALCVMVVLGQVWFCFFDPSFKGRVIVMSLASSILWGDVALALFQGRPQPVEPTRFFMVATISAMSLGFALWAALVFQGQAVSLLIPDPATNAGLLFFPLTATALFFGLVMLASARFARELEQGQAQLAQANQDLQQALDSVKTLSGLLPICASCKKIRDDQGYWRQIEAYLVEHTDAEFTHGICPACRESLYPQYAKNQKG